jgi:hypothetical protein
MKEKLKTNTCFPQLTEAGKKNGQHTRNVTLTKAINRHLNGKYLENAAPFVDCPEPE